MWQLIIVRKDLNMSPGKMAAQVSHASMAFLSAAILSSGADHVLSADTGETESYAVTLIIPADVYERWFIDIYTKTICEAKNRNQMMKAAAIADELGLVEERDYLLIHDHCLTELESENIGEDGIGRALTCIGFRPLPDDIAHAISRKFQLYK